MIFGGFFSSLRRTNHVLVSRIDRKKVGACLGGRSSSDPWRLLVAGVDSFVGDDGFFVEMKLPRVLTLTINLDGETSCNVPIIGLGLEDNIGLGLENSCEIWILISGLFLLLCIYSNV